MISEIWSGLWVQNIYVVNVKLTVINADIVHIDVNDCVFMIWIKRWKTDSSFLWDGLAFWIKFQQTYIND